MSLEAACSSKSAQTLLSPGLCWVGRLGLQDRLVSVGLGGTPVETLHCPAGLGWPAGPVLQLLRRLGRSSHCCHRRSEGPDSSPFETWQPSPACVQTTLVSRPVRS